MHKLPFNVRPKPGMVNVMHRGVHIGYAWPVRVPKSKVRKKGVGGKLYDRWASCTLDGEMVTKGSRTVGEAARAIRLVIYKRAHPPKS